MRTLFALLLLFGCIHSALTQNQTAIPTIDFSKSIHLKAVYDSGLQPWSGMPNEERNSLFITDEFVRVITPRGGSFEMNVEWGSFSLLAESDLNDAEFISHPGKYDEMLEQAKAIAKALDIDITSKDGKPGLEQEAARFYRQWNRIQNPSSWHGSNVVDRKPYSLRFFPLYNGGDVIAKIAVTLDFRGMGFRPTFLRSPVKPPPGYEHLSLARVKKDRPTSPEESNREFNKIRAANAPSGKNAGTNQPGVSANPSSESTNANSSASVSSPPNVWDWKVGLGIAAFLLLAVFAIYRFLNWHGKQ